MMKGSGSKVEFSSDDVVEQIEADRGNVYTSLLIREITVLKNQAQQELYSPHKTNEESKRLSAEVEFWKLGIELLESLWPLAHNPVGR